MNLPKRGSLVNLIVLPVCVDAMGRDQNRLSGKPYTKDAASNRLPPLQGFNVNGMPTQGLKLRFHTLGFCIMPLQESMTLQGWMNKSISQPEGQEVNSILSIVLGLPFETAKNPGPFNPIRSFL